MFKSNANEFLKFEFYEKAGTPNDGLPRAVVQLAAEIS